MKLNVTATKSQMLGLLLNPKYRVSVEGRGTGKSFDIGFMMGNIVRAMPRSITAITGKTYGQLLTNTLPSSFKLLEKMGFVKDVHYVVCKRPPKGFITPYEQINRYDNVISFANGACFTLISQSEKGSGRGKNIDFEIMDEALTINKEQYDYEVSPANRGNNEYFGPRSVHPVSFHHGFKYSTSMPPTKSGRWVLEYAKYYEEEKGVNLFSVWNRVVKMQMELLNIEDKRQFAECWNEIIRMKRKITPFVSRDGLLFTCSNAFDNLENLGFSYVRREYAKQPYLTFLIEVMNYLFDRVEDCFYSINEEKQIYYNYAQSKMIMDMARENNFNYNPEDILQSSVYDKDCNPSLPLWIVPDWGSAISLFSVSQDRNYDFVADVATRQTVHNVINEFFVKPDGNSNILIHELCSKFSNYYSKHGNRELHFVKDRYGDSRNPNVVNSKTFNEMATEYLTSAGWHVIEHAHPGEEPPQSDKYLLINSILKEEDPALPLFRINGSKCRFTLISMNNAMVKEMDGNMAKDKSSERKGSGVLPEEATHFSDAVDKILWTKYGSIIKGENGEWMPVRINGKTM